MTVRTWLVGGVGLVAVIAGAVVVVPRFLGANPIDALVDAPRLVAQVAEPDLQFAPVPLQPAATPQPSRRTSPADGFFDPGLDVPQRPQPRTPAGSVEDVFTPSSGELLFPFSEPSSTSTSAPAAEELPVDATLVDPTPLRRELMELLQEKADLLAVPQLQAEIIRTQRDIRELKAQERLEQLRHELERLSRDYPQTWGGESARKLFHVPLPAVGPTPGTIPFSPGDSLSPGSEFQPGPVYHPAPTFEEIPRTFAPARPQRKQS